MKIKLNLIKLVYSYLLQRMHWLLTRMFLLLTVATWTMLQKPSNANLKLRERSYVNPYFTVGKIPRCTATWMGNDDDSGVNITAAAYHIVA